MLWFGGVDAGADELVTISGSGSSLPGTEVGAAKVTPMTQYPAKGRATSGVRCHRFLKGEDALIAAAIGPSPVIATAASGSPIELPEPTDRRDGSGVPLTQPVASLAGRGAGRPTADGARPDPTPDPDDPTQSTLL